MRRRAPPLSGFEIYVAGLHCGRHGPAMQMEAHHFCKQANADFLQCVIFDSNTEEANLIGIEYIISERLFNELPEAEREYWHPHNYEVFSGQLVAPGLPEITERELMSFLVNSYGKTWHLWHTGRHDGQAGHSLPRGEAMLMWSFNRDGHGQFEYLAQPQPIGPVAEAPPPDPRTFGAACPGIMQKMVNKFTR